MKRGVIHLMLIALAVATLGTFGTAPAFASAGCGTTQDWHYISQAQSDVLDGNTESFATGVFAGSDWYSTSQAWQLRTQVWGTGAAETYLVNEFTPQSPYATPISQVSTVWLEGKTPSGSSLTFQSSLCPNTSTSSEPLWTVVLDSVPYLGNAFTAYANSLSFGVSALAETSYDNDLKWTGVSSNYVVPDGVSTSNAEAYYAYAQQMLVNASAGYEVHTDGAVGYTTTYEPIRNDYLQSYDDSGTAGSTGQIEPY